jgi:imidazolonepropionase-like amidohydrolase
MQHCVHNLAGVFTGEGFAKKQGRRPEAADCGFIRGPIDILCNHRGSIESLRRTSARRKPQGRFTDGTGRFATAGFVDSHTHSLFAGSRSSEFFMRWQGRSYAEIAAQGGGIHSTASEVRRTDDRQLAASLNLRNAPQVPKLCENP